MTATNQTILLTGADGALGSAALSHFSRRGCTVIATTFSQAGKERAHSILREGNEKNEAHILDLSSLTACQAFAADILSHHRVDCILNAAGGFRYTTTADCSQEDFEFLLTSNFISCWHLAKCFTPALVQQKSGRMVFVTTRKTKEAGQAGFGIYTATKAALEAMTTSLADELKGSGVTVNMIAPSVIDTPANREAMGIEHADKWVTTADLLQAVDFLFSKDAGAINGSTVTISGGL